MKMSYLHFAVTVSLWEMSLWHMLNIGTSGKKGLSFLNVPHLSSLKLKMKDYNFLQLSAKKENTCSILLERHIVLSYWPLSVDNTEQKGLNELTQWEMWFDALISQLCSHSFNHCLTLQPHRLRITKHDFASVCMTKHIHKHTLCISILVKNLHSFPKFWHPPFSRGFTWVKMKQR